MADATERARLGAEIAREANLDRTFLALTGASCAIATFGLLANSVAVIIGAMLIAPLMSPIVALALGLVGGEFAILRRAAATLAAGSAMAVGFSALLSLVVNLPTPGSEILARGQPTLLDLGVALAAGAIAGYARVRASIAASVGGAAIAVALMPPLCVVGIALSSGRSELAYGAGLLFATNIIGITLACAAVFAASGLARRGHALGGLLTTVALVALVAIPLGFATLRLIEQSHLEASLRAALLDQTQTFRRVQLVGTSIDWLARPIRIDLFVRAEEPVTPTQVGYLQAFAQRQIHRPLTLTVDVSQFSAVRAEPATSPTSR